MIAAACPEADRSFGPSVPPDCRSGFDFTLYFEQIFLSLVPAALFLVFAAVRLVRLVRASIVTTPSWAHKAKLGLILILIALRLTLLVLWCLRSSVRNDASIPSAAVSLATAFAIAILSHYEHTRSIRPSATLNIYLFFAVLCDATQARTLWLRHVAISIPAVFTAALAVQMGITYFEAREKDQISLGGDVKVTPESRSSVYNLSVFWWLNRLFWSGYKKPLALEDLYPLESDLASKKLGDNMAKTWSETKQSRKHSLLIAASCALRWPLLAPVPARLALIGFKYCQPFLLSAAVDYVDSAKDNRSQNVDYGLIGATGLIYLGIALSTGIYNFKVYRATTMLRGSLVSIVYKKTLRIRLADAKESAAITHASSDIDRISISLESAHEIWASSVESIIAIVLLERQLGWACIAPVLLALFATASNTWIGKYIPGRQRQWSAAIQKRVTMTSSVLRNMKSVKMTGLSEIVESIIQNARVHELDLSRRYRSFFAYMAILGMFISLETACTALTLRKASIPVQLSAPFTFLIFITGVQWYGGQVSAARAFSSLSLIQLLTTPLQKVLSSFPNFAASLGTFRRIQDYLLLDERVDGRLLDLGPGSSSPSTPPGSYQHEIELHSLVPKRSDSSQSGEGHAISCQDGGFAAVRDGKILLHNIDLSCAVGSLIMVIGPIGSGKTILLNALLGEIEISQGSLLSQFSQIAYCPQTPWVINASIKDNILDHTPCDEEWYNKVLWCCALDEDIQHFTDGDETKVGSRGITLSGGQKQRLSLARAVYARKKLVFLDDVLSALDARTEKLVFERLFSQHGLLRSHGTTVVLVSHAVHQIRAADAIVVLGDGGHIVQQGTFDSLSSQDGYVQCLLQNLTNEKDLDDEPSDTQTGDTSVKASKQAQVKTASVSSDGKKKRAPSDTAVFSYYFKSIGTWLAFVFLITTVISTFCTNFPQIWVQWWTESKISNNASFLGAFFAFAIGAIITNAASIWCMMIIIVPISAAKLHSQLLHAVLCAPLSFFSSTDSGMTLNRFSQDMSLINSRLPVSTMQATTMALQTLAQIGLMATGSTYFAVLIPVVMIATWVLQKFYLRTSRQLRLLDLEQKSPLFSSISETLEGLAIIRAFGRQEQYETRNQERLDTSQRPVYLLYCIQRWLNFVLDLIVAALAVLLMTLATQLPNSTSGASLSVALLNVLNFSQSLAQFIYYYTDLETSLQAVARVKDYVETTQPEDSLTATILTSPPEDWPTRGSIEFRGATASYTLTSDTVVKDVSFHIKPGQKIGICGRTGSGKSSLLSALFRMMELRSGGIYVDGIDLSSLPRQTVRSRLIAIPQDPFLPPGSVRFNMSPSGSAADDQIITALGKVGLWPLVQQHGGLDSNINTLSLSHGQQQLFCLARAMLRPGMVLVLDEATSNVDWETDDKIQKIIREEFANRTILTVAHRLTTILDSDQVIVMGQGTVLEAGPPAELLAQRGPFRNLYDAQTANRGS